MISNIQKNDKKNFTYDFEGKLVLINPISHKKIKDTIQNVG